MFHAQIPRLVIVSSILGDALAWMSLGIFWWIGLILHDDSHRPAVGVAFHPRAGLGLHWALASGRFHLELSRWFLGGSGRAC